jgi:hypothetical protein
MLKSRIQTVDHRAYCFQSPKRLEDSNQNADDEGRADHSPEPGKQAVAQGKLPASLLFYLPFEEIAQSMQSIQKFFRLSLGLLISTLLSCPILILI